MNAWLSIDIEFIVARWRFAEEVRGDLATLTGGDMHDSFMAPAAIFSEATGEERLSIGSVPSLSLIHI